MSKLVQALPVQRDKNGEWGNPEIPDFGEDISAYNAWLAEQGLETECKFLESEDLDHPTYISYFEGGDPCFRDWEPSAPAGEGWFTLAITETEDGPAWVWARRVEQIGGAQ